MKVLGEKFKTYDDAKEFWDKSVYDMLDISMYLTNCGLKQEGAEFCKIFTENAKMELITKYKFNFDIIKKFLHIPNEYVPRNIGLGQLEEFYKKEVPANLEELKDMINDVLVSAYKEIEQLQNNK